MEREEQIRHARQLLQSGVLSEESANAIKADFPELRENEDERIRKGMLDIFKNSQSAYWNGMKTSAIVAYLEKQKEQKSLPPVSSGARYYFDEWIKQQPILKYWDAFLAGIDFNKKEQKVILTRETILGIWELGNFWKENPEAREGLTQLQYIQKYWNEKCDYQKEQDKCPEYCVRSHCIGCSIYEKKKEIPMPGSTELIKMWDREKAMLKEKDFRGDEWRLAQNAFMDGFSIGTCVKSEKQKEPEDKGNISDGYHTFNELYYYRMLYNAAFFNLLPKEWVHKSKRHHDGEECFGGGWFIVMANLPTGQISNHYELKDWELFQIPEKEIADEWDGHTPQEAAERIHEYLLEKQKEQQPEQTDLSYEEIVRNAEEEVDVLYPNNETKGTEAWLRRECLREHYMKGAVGAAMQSLGIKEQKPLTVEDVVEQSKRFGREVEVLHKDEQKPADDKTFEEWIDGLWKQHKVNNPNSYDKGDEIQFNEWGFKNFCRGIRKMYQQKPAECQALNDAFTASKQDFTLSEKELAVEYSDSILPTSIVNGENEDEYKLHKIIEAAFIAGQTSQKPAEWGEEDKALFGLLHQCVCRCVNDDRMIYSERERISKAMFPFIEKLEAFRSQPKQEWNEEDKKVYYRLLNHYESMTHCITTAARHQEIREELNFLKSLRLSWKPSEDDLDAFKELIDDANKRGWVTPGASRLYEQLKAL